MQPSVDARRFSRRSLAFSVIVLGSVALVARLAVDDGDDYYSGSEFDAWLVVVGTATVCSLALGLGLVRRPVGRGILLGTGVAGVLTACAVLVGAYVSVTTGPY